MKTGKAFPMPLGVGGQLVVWYVHVNGDVCDGPPSRSHGAVKTRRGWCYFRRATKQEILKANLNGATA